MFLENKIWIETLMNLTICCFNHLRQFREYHDLQQGDYDLKLEMNFFIWDFYYHQNLDFVLFQ